MQHVMVEEALESVNYHAGRILGTIVDSAELVVQRLLDARKMENVLFSIRRPRLGVACPELQTNIPRGFLLDSRKGCSE